MNFKDRVFSYGIINGVRYNEKQKKRFLRTAQVEFESMSFQTQVVQSDLKMALNQTLSYYNLYIGDFKKTKYVIATYYDTAVRQLVRNDFHAFERGNSKKNMIIQYVLALMLVLILTIFAYYAIIPNFQSNGLFSMSGIITLGYLFVSLYLVSKISRGFPNKYNFVRNTSSILAVLDLANSLKSKNIGFALLDGGTTTDYGLKMLKSYVGDNCEIIYLDSIGNAGPIQVFSNNPTPYLSVIPNNFQLPADCLITFGELSDRNVRVANANTPKDNTIREETYQLNFETLLTTIEKIT